MHPPKRILIIDDNADVRDLLALELTECGFTTATAPSGAEGLHRMGAFDPEVVLCDVVMPEMDAMMFARRLREDARWTHVVLVAFSSAAFAVGALAALTSAGFLDFVQMPATIERLCDVCDREVTA